MKLLNKLLSWVGPFLVLAKAQHSEEHKIKQLHKNKMTGNKKGLRRIFFFLLNTVAFEHVIYQQAV